MADYEEIIRFTEHNWSRIDEWLESHDFVSATCFLCAAVFHNVRAAKAHHCMPAKRKQGASVRENAKYLKAVLLKKLPPTPDGVTKK